MNKSQWKVGDKVNLCYDFEKVHNRLDIRSASDSQYLGWNSMMKEDSGKLVEIIGMRDNYFNYTSENGKSWSTYYQCIDDNILSNNL